MPKNLYVPVAGALRLVDGRPTASDTNTALACDAAIEAVQHDPDGYLFLSATKPKDRKYGTVPMAYLMRDYILASAPPEVRDRIMIRIADRFDTIGEIRATLAQVRALRKSDGPFAVGTVAFCVKHWQGDRVSDLVGEAFDDENPRVRPLVCRHDAPWSPWALVEGIKTRKHLETIRGMKVAGTW